MIDILDSMLPTDSISEFPVGAYDQLVHLAREGQVVPFIGAGISAHTLPLWIQLLEQVYRRVVPCSGTAAAATDAWKNAVVEWGCGYMVPCSFCDNHLHPPEDSARC